MNITMATPQPIFVIIEQIYNKSGMPSLGNTIGPSLRQVVRRVAQVHAVQDVFFEGQRIEGMPTTMQNLREFLTPGQQITTRPTGEKSLVLVYAGYTNLLTPLQQMGNIVPEAITQERTLPTWTGGLFRYGTDPVPNIVLQGNPRVMFTMPGGNGPQTAVAIYNQQTRSLELPTPDMRAQAIRSLTAAR